MWRADGETRIVNGADHPKPNRLVLRDSLDGWLDHAGRAPAALDGALDAPHIGLRLGVRPGQDQVGDWRGLGRLIRLRIGRVHPLRLGSLDPVRREKPLMPNFHPDDWGRFPGAAVIALLDQ